MVGRCFKQRVSVIVHCKIRLELRVCPAHLRMWDAQPTLRMVGIAALPEDGRPPLHALQPYT